VILPTTARDGACILAERMRKAVASVSFPQGSVTVSIGASALAPDSTDASPLVAAADNAMYAAKQGGRNRVVHADSAQT